MKQALEHITKYIKLYRESDPEDGNTLVECLQQITSTLFYLEKERAVYHDMFQKKINELIAKEMSVSRSENEAHVLFPEMYMLRRVMDSAYTTCDAIRTQISWIKSGLVNS